MAENVNEFQKWFNQCIKDGQEKLNLTDRTLAYILLREGLNFYLKQICEEQKKRGIR